MKLILKHPNQPLRASELRTKSWMITWRFRWLNQWSFSGDNFGKEYGVSYYICLPFGIFNFTRFKQK